MTRDQIDPSVGTDMPVIGYDARPSTGSKRHPLGWLLRGLAVFALLAPVSMITASPVAAAPLAATGACATGVGNQGGAGIICDVTIVNNITSTGGTATVTVRECLGSSGDPTDGAVGHPCTTKTTSLTAPVTSVTQCNGSANGGGAALHCSVVITNNFIGVSPGATAVTVNQCVGSGATTGCSPFPATATGAAITQCNGSANGGTLVQMTCTANGTKSSTFAVTINQCNGSGNGGGGLAICSASMTNAAAPAPGTSAAPGTSPAPGTSAVPGTSPALGITPPPTSTLGAGPRSDSAPLFPLMILLALSGLGLATVATQRRRIHN